MALLSGVTLSHKKDGTLYYRSSITYKNKHISLGSFDTEVLAHEAYQSAERILYDLSYKIEDHSPSRSILSFEKWVILLNFRDNGIYFKTPIYLRHRFFLYYIEEHTVLKFAADDLFYYANHKIMKRGGHLFVADFGMQVNILSRYGIKNFAVPGRDYIFSNGDSTDYRYENISIINKYYGVQKITVKGLSSYISKIHIRGDFIIGTYPDETTAAIAFNKAANLLTEKGLKKQFSLNYINDLSGKDYMAIYDHILLPKKIRNYTIKE
ncbi:MAG: hypothetical protein RSB37_01185 [Acetivibrio sp.]